MNNILPIFNDANNVDGFSVFPSHGGSNSSWKVLDGSKDTHYRSDINPSLPGYLTVTFPHSYDICGYSIYIGDSVYSRMKSWEFQGLFNNEWISLHSGFNKNEPNTITTTFPLKSLGGVRIKCNSRYGSNSWGFTQLKVFGYDAIFLLKMDDSYYSIKDEYYHLTSKRYIPFDKVDFNKTFFISDLYKNKSFNGETFKPIDKFDNFTIISSENVDLKIQGIKTNSELIVMNYDELIDESQIQLIHYFNILGSSNNKVVFSFDSGLSWDTYNNGFIKLDNTVDLDNSNDNDWNLFKDEVITRGVTILDLSSIDFNVIDFNKIRFAYVIIRDNYESDSTIDNNTLTYDELAHLIKVKSDEMDLRRFTHTVQVTSNYDATYSETRIFLNQKFDPDDNEDDRVILDAPTLEGIKTDNYISLSWNSIENCDYYRLYLNGEIIYQGNDLHYNHPMGKRGSYTFAVRAYSNNVKQFKESEFSNIYNVDTYGYLATANNKYVVVQKDGKWYKFLAKR